MILQMLWNAVESSWSLLTKLGTEIKKGWCTLNWGNCTISTVNIKKQNRSLKRQGISTVVIATGSTVSEGSCYPNLGAVLNSLSENIEAKEYLEKALAIAKKLNNVRGESLCYGSLGNVFTSLGVYAKAKKYYEKALALWQKIGFKENVALCYANLASVCKFLGQHDNAKEHLERDDNAKAKEYYKKALAITKDIGDKST